MTARKASIMSTARKCNEWLLSCILTLSDLVRTRLCNQDFKYPTEEKKGWGVVKRNALAHVKTKKHQDRLATRKTFIKASGAKMKRMDEAGTTQRLVG